VGSGTGYHGDRGVDAGTVDEAAGEGVVDIFFDFLLSIYFAFCFFEPVILWILTSKNG